MPLVSDKSSLHNKLVLKAKDIFLVAFVKKKVSGFHRL